MLGGFAAPPPKPFDYGASSAAQPFNYGSASAPTPFSYNIPPQQPQNMEKKEINVNQDFILVSFVFKYFAWLVKLICICWTSF